MDDLEDDAPPNQSIGGRTACTQVRLRRQGFQALSRDKTDNFVVRSIRRGSDDWLSLIKPFVADLAFRSLVKPRQYSEARFRPYACHAAVLFVDLSSYSKITAALAHKGAHALSTVVNAYLGRLLQIIHSFGGDVVKFAGDAVLVVWEGPQNDLAINVLAAAKCVLTLQGEAGIHPIEGTSLAFKIHCGLACGLLDSEVFEAPRHVHMQRLYHSVGGEPMEEIGELVDLAAAGEVCVSQDCIEFLGDRAVFRDLRDTLAASHARILVGLTVEDSLLERMETHVTQTMADRIGRRNSKIEEDFIHPSVLRQLSHGGMSPTQIAQMRSLCILFIAMVANGSSVNWLMEVQGILDRNRCPIVQIIDDDKGVHVVAAVNLYEAIPESAMLGLQVCQDLKEQQVGCAIGMAMGSSFCGVTGSSSISCRWDITGPPAVRAARLMQYAIQHGHEAVIDHSVYKDPMASTHMALLEKAVELKGSPDPCPVYSLSTSKNSSALRILESEYASVHDDTVREIEECLSTGSRARRAVIITGPPLSGKKIVAQRAAGYAGLTPFLHVSSESGGYLQLARTIATWYAYDEDEDIQFGAREILEHLDANRWSRAHDACVELINLAVALGLKACFVVDRSQFLDEFSFSLIRECLRLRVRSRGGRQLVHEWSRRMSDLSEHGSEQSSHTGDSSSSGRICFLCIHVPLYQWQSARDVADRMCAKASYRMSFPLFTLGPVGENDLRMMMRDLADMEVSDRWLEIYAQSSGFCAGYFVERAAASRIISGVLWSQGKKGLAITNEDMELTIPSGMMKMNQNMTVHQASAEVAMKFTQTYDELPPLFQTFTKVLTMATRGGYYSLPRKIMWEVLNDLIAEGVDHNVLHTVIEEMVDMFHIREGTNCTGDPDISLMNPALADIAYDVCTPIQIESICMALIERMEPIQDSDFRVPFVMASFYHRIGSNEHVMKHLWKKGYAMFLAKGDTIPESKRYRILEGMDEEIVDAGHDTHEVLGQDFDYPHVSDKTIGTDLPLIKIYMAPIAFGPMGHTLTVLTRNIFHEMKNFRENRKKAAKCRLVRSNASACARYCKEVQVVEQLLTDYGFGIEHAVLENEFELIMDLAHPAQSPEDVQLKASRAHRELIPQFIEPRRERLLQVMDKLWTESICPPSVANGDPVLKRAFAMLQSGNCMNDAAHDALMVLAVNHWKPKRSPEYLPLLHYQTVSRIRNKVVRRLSDAELVLFRHQQGPRDLGAFLVTTPLLYEAGEDEKWYI